MGGYFLLSFLLLSLLSYDSYLMNVAAHRIDTAWFFMCGKAWMEGMTPYVDFADSKGILLWLIYGIGYLLSPTSYLGVFWLSVIAYAVTFHFIWQTARLFLDRRQSLLVLAVMPFFLFFNLIHCDVRSEDFCYPAVCAGIYFSILVLRDPSRSVIRRCAFCLGIAMMWCLLIKWSIFFMMGGMALIVLGVSFSKKSADGLIFGLLGMAVMALPFLVYFVIEGNFGAFVQEYFISTFNITAYHQSRLQIQSHLDQNTLYFFLLLCACTTISVILFLRKFTTDNQRLGIFSCLLVALPICISICGRVLMRVIQQWSPELTFATFEYIALATIVIGIYLFCRRFKVSFWLLLSFLPFFCFLGLKCLFQHYFTIASPFYFFIVTYMISTCCNIKKGILKQAMTSAVIVVLCGVIFNMPWRRFMFMENTETNEREAIMNLIAKKRYAKIVFVGMEQGEGLLAQALPGCKYWSLQSGATEEMFHNRNEAIREGKPDFVVANFDRLPSCKQFLKKGGYKLIYTSKARKTCIYAK